MSYSYDTNSINLSDDAMDTITISSGAMGSSDQIYSISGNAIGDSTLTGSSGLYWGAGQALTTNSVWGNITISEPSLKGASLSVKGDADFEGEVTIKGKSLFDMFEKIEERLAILHPNPNLEDKWDELKELGKRYKELEQEIIEKEKMWAILQK
jgi:hypothetical protein